MYFIQLQNSPHVVRFYPNYTKTRFQYHPRDQEKSLTENRFDRHNGTMLLHHFGTPRFFSSIIELYFFLTEFRQNIPHNLSSVFRIYNKEKNSWVKVNRPLLHAPHLYCR